MSDRDVDTIVVVDLHGELDLGSESAIVDRIAAVDNHAQRIIVDLTDVRFLDAHTVGVLLRAQRSAADRGVQLKIQHAHGIALEVLAVTGALHILSDPIAATHGVSRREDGLKSPYNGGCLGRSPGHDSQQR